VLRDNSGAPFQRAGGRLAGNPLPRNKAGGSPGSPVGSKGAGRTGRLSPPPAQREDRVGRTLTRVAPGGRPGPCPRDDEPRGPGGGLLAPPRPQPTAIGTKCPWPAIHGASSSSGSERSPPPARPPRWPAFGPTPPPPSLASVAPASLPAEGLPAGMSFGHGHARMARKIAPMNRLEGLIPSSRPPQKRHHDPPGDHWPASS